MSPANDNKMYDGPLSVRKNTKLPIEAQVIEHHFAVELQRDLEASRQAYNELVEGQNMFVLDTDKARSLSTVWDLSDTSRAIFSAAVQTPAAAFIGDMYERIVKGQQTGYVIFMAGGGGAGKTAAAQIFADDQALLIYDTTFSHPTHAFRNVRLALANGRRVTIVYVYRPFQNAVRGVIARAVLTGRTVPLHILARDHVEAPKTVLQVAREYEQNNDVDIFVFNNSGNDAAEGKIIVDWEETLHFLEQVAYNENDDFIRQASEVLENEKSNGRGQEYILRALEPAA